MRKITQFVSFRQLFILALLTGGLIFSSCGDSNETTQTESEAPTLAEPSAPIDEGKGIGPVTHVDIPATIDAALVAKGKTIFEGKCTPCHNADETKKVGPGLKGVTERRKPEWIMNMILNPSEMTQKDPQAMELLATYLAPMANQNLTEEEARSILEYFRQNDSK
jgi:mono/diheme cytochrome c family protein